MTDHASLDPDAQNAMSNFALQRMRQRARVLQVLDAAERAAIAPLRTQRLHTFAYLADVLSPVWHLSPFDGKVLKVTGGPHYPDLQREVDQLVVHGLIKISGLQYMPQPDGGCRVDAYYSLNFELEGLEDILRALGARDREAALDWRDCEFHNFLLDLAGALATVPDKNMDEAAAVDATYADERFDVSNVVDFASWSTDPATDNLSYRTAEKFQDFLPEDAKLSGGEKLYLYASFLGRRLNAT